MYREETHMTALGLGESTVDGVHSGDITRGTSDTITRRQICRTLALTDFGLIVTLALAAYGSVQTGASFAGLADHLSVVLLAAVLSLNLFNMCGVYARKMIHRPASSIPRIGAAWFATGAAVSLVAGLGEAADLGRLAWTPVWFGSVLVALIGTRVLFATLATRWALEGRLGRRVAIVGDPMLVRRLNTKLINADENVVHVVGLYSDQAEAGRSDARQFGALNGDCDAMIADLRRQPVDSVVIALPEGAPERLVHLRRRLTELPVDIHLCPGNHAIRISETDVTTLAGIPIVEVAERPLSGWRSTVKEAEDRVIGFMISLAISPILLGIALAIKLDSPGPVFFKQKRTGYNNRMIEVLKFRTMYVDQSDSDGNRLTERDDPRVTRVGNVLRRWSLDELPQFLNVLRGDMSIVGPRPHALSAKAAGKLYRDAVPGYDARHRVKPGITGLAQIRGWRGPTETERQIRKRVEYDIRYIENWSLLLDLKIIFITAFTGFKSENAF